MEAKDYPTPSLEGTAMYTEACQLSAKLRNAPRPQKPLKIIIAGAGQSVAVNSRDRAYKHLDKLQSSEKVEKIPTAQKNALMHDMAIKKATTRGKIAIEMLSIRVVLLLQLSWDLNGA